MNAKADAESLADFFHVGDYVVWKWAGGIAHGTITQIASERTQIASNGKIITRNGTLENPAVVVAHASGNEVLKLASELEKTS